MGLAFLLPARAQVGLTVTSQPVCDPGMGARSNPSSIPMLMRRWSGGVRVHAPAKVNLFLEVLRRRADGYHELATLMVAVSLHDTLDLTPAADGVTRLECDCPGLSTG